MSEWQEVKLKEICKFKYGSNLPANFRIEGNYPVYGSSSVVSHHIDYYVKGPGIIVGRKGTVGKVQYSPTDFFPIDTTFYIEHNLNKVDLKFLYYRLQISGLDTMNSDAAVPGLNRIAAINQKIDLPPLPTQQKIAKILSNYDDLIENNLKRIKLLEESARLTYEDWLLRRKVHGEIVPDLEITDTPLVEMIDDYMNGGWGKEDPEGGYIHQAYVIRGTDMPDISQGEFSRAPLRFHTESNLKPRKLNIGDIAIEMSNGNIGNVGRSIYFDSGINSIFSEGCMCASFCKMIKPKSLGFSYLIDSHLKYIHNTDEMLIYKSQGANGINNFRFKDMVNDEVISIPNGRHLINLTEIFKNIYSEKSNLTIQIKLLKEARDILLPRLMTGMIDTDNMDIAV